MEGDLSNGFDYSYLYYNQLDGATISYCQLLKLLIFEYHQRSPKLRKIRSHSETLPL